MEKGPGAIYVGSEETKTLAYNQCNECKIYLEFLNLPKLADFKQGRNQYFSELECVRKFM